MPRVPTTPSLIHKLREAEGDDGHTYAEVGSKRSANELLGCATSRPMDHSDTPVMHGLIGERGGVGAFGGWRGSGGRGGGSGEVVIEAVCVR